MEIDKSNLTDEQITKLGEFIHSMENENKKVQKWWVIPKYSCFSKEVQEFGQSYVVEPQKDSYSKSRPPLKSDFESKEAAEKWLIDYWEEESLFKSAEDDIDNLVFNLGHVVEKLQKHEYITKDDWTKCFELYIESLNNGSLNKVTEE